MPETSVYFYQEPDGSSPVLNWFRELKRTNEKAFLNCLARLRLLRMLGHELRRPAADLLQDGIYELRAKSRTVQYRMLYFYHGLNIAVVAHTLTKEKNIPAADLARALSRRRRYEQNPTQHRCPQTIEDLHAPA